MMFDLPAKLYAVLTKHGLRRGPWPPLPFSLSVSEIANLAESDPEIRRVHNLPLPRGYAVFTTSSGPTPMAAWHRSWLWSSGSLCSTAFDLARWSHFLASGVVMQPASYATMKTPVPPAIPYGFGLVVQNILGRPAVWHDGAIFGYVTYLAYFSGQDIAVAVNMNTFPSPAAVTPEGIALAVANAALNTQ